MTFISNPAYNATDEANRNAEIDPITEHNIPNEHIIDESGQASATYRAIVDLSSYKNWSINWLLSADVIMTFWVTNDPSATDAADTGWTDITNELAGTTGITSATAGTIAFADSNIRVGRLMIKHIVSNTGTTIDVHMSRGN